MVFSEKLQMLRKTKGYSQEKLAERLEVSRQAVAKWESGLSYPELMNLIQISHLFHVDEAHPYRGPERYQSGQYTYKSTVMGNIEWFQGYEEIECEEIKVYECYFHGGLIK